MMYALCGGPIIEYMQDGVSRFAPAWWVDNQTWGEAALTATAPRLVDPRQVALQIVDTLGQGLRTAALWAASGEVAQFLSGWRGFRADEGVGGYYDLVLDADGKVAGDAPENVTLAHIGWTQTWLVEVRQGAITHRALEGAPGWQEIAGGLLGRAYQEHVLRLGLLECAWQAHTGRLPFMLTAADLAALQSALAAAGVTHLSGLGWEAIAEVYGEDRPWQSEARGLVKFGRFLEQRAR